MLVFLGASSLWAQKSVSKKELYSRAREVLMESLVRKDSAHAEEAYGYLQAHVSEGAPLTIFEEYLIDMEMGKYADGVRKYASEFRIMLDSSYIPGKETERFSENDALHKHLYRPFDPFTAAKADSMVKLVDASNVDAELKDLYATIIYAEITIGFETYKTRSGTLLFRFVRDTSRVDQFLARAHNYVEKNPYAEHSGYLKYSTIPMVEKMIGRMREFNEDPFKHKYYTGGIGVYGGVWTGIISGDVNDYFITKMGDDINMNFEASLLIRRVALNFFYNYGFVTKPENFDWDESEDEMIGFSLGFTAFDSRFVRVEPFVGYGVYDFMLVESSSDVLVLGLNTDLRLPLKKPSRYGGLALVLVARLKYQANFGTLGFTAYDREHNAKDVDAGFIAHQFGINLGLFLW